MEPDHNASSKVAQRVGMRFEGTRHKFFPIGAGIDMDIYATNVIDYRATD